MSGTSTVQSPFTLEQQLSRQPSSHSSWEMWRLCRESSVPSVSFTRHLPQEPLPEQGASMATLARRAASSRLSLVALDSHGAAALDLENHFAHVMFSFRLNLYVNYGILTETI